MRLIILSVLFWSFQAFAEEYPIIYLPIGPNSPASSANTFIDRENGFSAVIPDGWKRDSTEDSGAALAISDSSRVKSCVVQVNSKKRAKEFTVEQKAMFYTQIAGELMKTYEEADGNPNLSRQGLTPIANDIGMLVEFSYGDSGYLMKKFMINLVHKNGLLMVICENDAKNYKDSLPEFGVFVDSIKLIK